MAGEQLPAMPVAFPVAYWEAEVAAGEGVAALRYQGHLTPSAGLGSPRHKDVASDPAAGMSLGRAGATRGPCTTMSRCTPELWDGSAGSEAAARSPAHPGAGWASLTSSSGPPQISVQPSSSTLPSGCPLQSSPTEEPWACVHLPFSSGGTQVIRGDGLLTGGAGYSWRFVYPHPLIPRLISLPHLLSLHLRGI